MLNAITWEQFLTAVAVTILTYYLVIITLFFREELRNKLKGHSSSSDDQSLSNAFTDKDSNELIGSPLSNEGRDTQRTLASSIESQQLHFSQAEEDDASNALTDSRETILIGTVLDLIQELKLITESKTQDREELIQLLQTLLSRYEQLESTQYKETICHFLLVTLNDKTNHTFTITEIRSWWNKP